MEQLKKADIQQASKIFAVAMFNDDLHAWFFPEAKTRLQKLENLYRFMLQSKLKHSYKVSINMEGFCIWEKPDEHQSTITLYNIYYGSSLIYKIGLNGLFRMIRYQIWSTKIRNSLIIDKYWYLAVVTVSPEFQGKGFASKMIKPFLENATNMGEAVYLETQNIQNVPIYEKYGFNLIASKELGKTGITQYCMMKR